MFFYLATETRTNRFVMLVLNDVRQTETSIHFKQNGCLIIINGLQIRESGNKAVSNLIP
jgi:hypothetical protein